MSSKRNLENVVFVPDPGTLGGFLMGWENGEAWRLNLEPEQTASKMTVGPWSQGWQRAEAFDMPTVLSTLESVTQSELEELEDEGDDTNE